MGGGGKTLGFVVCFAAGIAAAALLAVGGEAADSTSVDTTTSVTTTVSTDSDTTQEATTVTVATTATVERTTTQETIPTTTTTATSSDRGTPAWVWALLAILAVALAAVIVLLARRGRHHSLTPDERARRLDNAVSTWASQGWAVESRTLDSAVLQRAGERMIVAVDASGQITTLPG